MEPFLALLIWEIVPSVTWILNSLGELQLNAGLLLGGGRHLLVKRVLELIGDLVLDIRQEIILFWRHPHRWAAHLLPFFYILHYFVLQRLHVTEILRILLPLSILFNSLFTIFIQRYIFLILRSLFSILFLLTLFFLWSVRVLVLVGRVQLFTDLIVSDLLMRLDQLSKLLIRGFPGNHGLDVAAVGSKMVDVVVFFQVVWQNGGHEHLLLRQLLNDYWMLDVFNFTNLVVLILQMGVGSDWWQKLFLLSLAENRGHFHCRWDSRTSSIQVILRYLVLIVNHLKHQLLLKLIRQLSNLFHLRRLSRNN